MTVVELKKWLADKPDHAKIFMGGPNMTLKTFKLEYHGRYHGQQDDPNPFVVFTPDDE